MQLKINNQKVGRIKGAPEKDFNLNQSQIISDN